MDKVEIRKAEEKAAGKTERFLKLERRNPVAGNLPSVELTSTTATTMACSRPGDFHPILTCPFGY
jgi:hypothetical protein